ncbi:MAG TPA: ribonuclease HII [Deltaproteobacteria bacterium]|nr:ribonuclease HII [Deltaproteobacteria bacterium]
MTCPLRGLIAGIDEAGRAPLAGPVVSSCVVWVDLPQSREKVNDSKLLTEHERNRLFSWIMDNAYRVGVGMASHEEIERMNIHHATLLSMERAVENTAANPDILLVDGVFPLKRYHASKAIVKGDRKCFFMACASIIAKVTRDRLMAEYGKTFPEYLFEKNKGYPTPEHRKAIGQYGICPIHRKTFKGVAEYVGGERRAVSGEQQELPLTASRQDPAQYPIRKREKR